MIGSRKRSVEKLKGSGRKARESAGTSRLAEITARIDSARNAAVVRRPVFNRRLNVIAYELVLGDGPITEIEVEDNPDGRRRLLANSLVDLDVEAIRADKPVQLTMCSSVIEAGLPPELGPEQIMPVLGSGVELSPALIAGLEDLRAQGHAIVLDDLAANPRLHSLLKLASAVRINIAIPSPAWSAQQIAVYKAAGVVLIADGVGSYEELRNAIKLGFDQFQGSFLSRPNAFRKSGAPEGQMAALELITLLQDPDADISDVADVIRSDVSLSYRIMKVVNSAQYSLPRPLGSIEEAVMLVGTKQIVSWVGMMNMTGLNGKPSELTRTAMVRAKACETLAESLGRQDLQRFYLVGLFSVIEAMLDVPAAQALQKLPLSTEIVDAIVAQGGIMGEVLSGVLAHEKGDWARAHIIGLEDKEVSAAFLGAIIDTDRAWSQIGE
jgi:c-di-GMP phosphodiesterase